MSRLTRTSVPTTCSSVEPPPMSTTSVPGSTAPIPRSVRAASSSPRQQASREPVAPLDLAEEGLAVLRVADGARRDAERPLRAELLELATVLGEDIAHARDRERQQPAARVDALTEPRDRQPPNDLLERFRSCRRRADASNSCRDRRRRPSLARHDGGDASHRRATSASRGRQDVQSCAGGAKAYQRRFQVSAALRREPRGGARSRRRRRDPVEAAGHAAEPLDAAEGFEAFQRCIDRSRNRQDERDNESEPENRHWHKATQRCLNELVSRVRMFLARRDGVAQLAVVLGAFGPTSWHGLRWSRTGLGRSRTRRRIVYARAGARVRVGAVATAGVPRACRT